MIIKLFIMCQRSMHKLSKLVNSKEVKQKKERLSQKQINKIINMTKKQSILYPLSQNHKSYNEYKQKASEPLASLSAQVRPFFQCIFNFSEKRSQLEQKRQQIVIGFFKSEADRNTILKILDEELLRAIKKFIKSIACIVQKYKPTSNAKIMNQSLKEQERQKNKDKFLLSIKEKIFLCGFQIEEIINEINANSPWCQCGRQKCSLKYDVGFTRNALFHRIEVQLGLQIGMQKEEESIVHEYTFFNIRNDSDCDLLSLKAIEGKKQGNEIIVKDKSCKKQPKDDEILEMLKSTRIDKDMRISCPNFNEEYCMRMIKTFVKLQ